MCWLAPPPCLIVCLLLAYYSRMCDSNRLSITGGGLSGLDADAVAAAQVQI